MSRRWDRFAPVWDALYGDQLRDGEAGFYTALAVTGRGLAVEPACGTGRVLAPLLAAGVPVWGADSSAAMIGLARARLRGVGGPFELHRQPLSSFGPPPGCGLVLLPLDALRLLRRRRDQRRFLARAAACLGPHGRLALDLTLPNAALPEMHQSETVHLADGRTAVALTRWRVRLKSTREETRVLIGRPGRRIRAVRCRQTYANLTAPRVERLLAEAGLVVEARYADFFGAPFSDDSARLVLVARREGLGGTMAKARRR